MNEIQVFNSEQFGQVRVVKINGEPWFVATDICKILEIEPTATRRLKDKYKSALRLTQTSSNGVTQEREMTVVNESGMYKLVLKSRKKEAEAFQDWITDDVLPSLRKHGAYIVGQDSMTREQLVAKALVAANDIIAERDKTINQLNETVAIMEPKARYYDIVLACKDLVPTTIISKDYGWSATKLNRWLNENGYQYRRGNTWVLYEKYADKGYTSSKTHVYEDKSGREHSTMQTQWTQAGRLFVYNELKKRGILPMIEQDTMQERM